MHQFGANVDRVVAPTTRDQGSKAAIDLQVMGRANAAANDSPSKNRSVEDESAKRAAIKELNREKDQMYNDLKSSLGQTEADEHIRVFMVSLSSV